MSRARGRLARAPLALRRPITVMLNPEAIEALRELCAREDLSQGRILDRAIHAYVALLDEREETGS